MLSHRSKLTAVVDVKLLLTATLGAVDKVAIGTAAIYGLRDGEKRNSIIRSFSDREYRLTSYATESKICTCRASNIHGLAQFYM
jgi:hypothetical protein